MQKFEFTTEEKIRLVNGASFFGTSEIEEKEIRRLQLLDGGTGINFEQLFGDFISSSGKEGIGGDTLRDVLDNVYTPENLSSDESREMYQWIMEKLRERIPSMTAPGCYPPGILLGATWDPETVYAVGESLGKEARAFGINILLGTPNVNIHRDIRNGRLFEGYSEDPCVASELAPMLVKGVQSQGIAANVKHFAANHQETNRMNINEFIPERALHEIYYPGFKACVEAGVETVMSAYNQINGVPCTENSVLLQEMLRDSWGFEGVVMSDWGAVYNPANAVNAGNDLAMPGPISPEALQKAYDDGILSDKALSDSANRIANLAKKYALKPEGDIPVEETDKTAYDAAAEGIVLLKNDNDVLPLPGDSNISLYGKHAEYLLTCGEGSAGIHTNRNVSFLEALSECFKEVTQNKINDKTDTIIYVAHLPGQEGNDRKDVSLLPSVIYEINNLMADPQIRLMKKILILNVSGPVTLDGIDDKFDAIICPFLPGMRGAQALADIISGQINPSGKLPLTWPENIKDMPTYLNFPGDGMQVHYGEGIFVGYRWYLARGIKPLYPFGFGLSYTEFEVVSIKTDKDKFSDKVTVDIVVENKGARAGKTVLELYVSDVYSTLTKPPYELKAFRKVYIPSGETKKISIELERSAFESYDPNLKKWTFEEGVYKIMAGFSSEDIRAECEVYANVKSPYSYGMSTSVKIIMENDILHDCIREFFIKENLPWSAMKTSYEYTSQDKIGMILDNLGCTNEQKTLLEESMSVIIKK